MDEKDPLEVKSSNKVEDDLEAERGMSLDRAVRSTKFVISTVGLVAVLFLIGLWIYKEAILSDLERYDIYLNPRQYGKWIDKINFTFSGVLQNGLSNLSIINIGTTYLNQSIPAFIFQGHKSNEVQNAIGLDCGMHSREWISPAICRRLIYELIRCSWNTSTCDDEFRTVAYQFDWYIIPLLNWDGYYYSWRTDRNWRKNRFPDNSSECVGTDLNRNSDVAWGATGSSFSACSDTFGGNVPFSEIEMKSWKSFFEQAAQRSKLISYISIHNYGQRILSSYAVSRSVFPAEPQSIKKLNDSGKRISEAMSRVYNKKYIYGQSRDILYPSAGTSKDYIYDALGVPLCWTWELRDQGKFGFDLPQSQINETWHEVKAGLQELMKYIILTF